MEIDPHSGEQPNGNPAFMPGQKHYYGDVSRKLFLAGGILMIVFAPVYPDLLPVNNLFVVTGAVLLSIFAGVTNPKQFWVNVLDVIIAALSFLIFEAAIFQAYGTLEWFSLEFLVRQSIPVVFFFALYFSSKTVRGMLVR